MPAPDQHISRATALEQCSVSPIGALLPDALPAPRRALSAEMSPRARRAAWCPNNYTESERSAADRIIAAWNDVFAGCEGAALAQRGNQSNVRAAVRLLRRCACSGDIFAGIDETIVRAAIANYRDDRGCRKIRRWKRFADFLDPEVILQYAGQARVAASAHAVADYRARAMYQLHQRAAAVLRRGGIYDFVSRVECSRCTLADFFRALDRGELRGEQCAWIARLRAMSDERARLGDEGRLSLSDRAKNCYRAYFRADPRPTPESAARLLGIELALLDWDFAVRAKTAATTSPPTPTPTPSPTPTPMPTPTPTSSLPTSPPPTSPTPTPPTTPAPSPPPTSLSSSTPNQRSHHVL